MERREAVGRIDRGTAQDAAPFSNQCVRTDFASFSNVEPSRVSTVFKSACRLSIAARDI